MRIAGLIGQTRQLAKDSDLGPRAEGCLHFRHGSGSEALKEFQQRLKNKPDRPHNDRITPLNVWTSVILSFLIAGPGRLDGVQLD
jgi:hypothetical protein